MARDALTGLLRPHAEAITADAEAGDPVAKRVINLYELYRDFPEACAAGLCEAAFKGWLAKSGG